MADTLSIRSHHKNFWERGIRRRSQKFFIKSIPSINEGHNDCLLCALCGEYLKRAWFYLGPPVVEF